MNNKFSAVFINVKTFLGNIFFWNKSNEEVKIKLEEFEVVGPYSMIRNYSKESSIISIINKKTQALIDEIHGPICNSGHEKVIIYDIGANIGIYSLAYSKILNSKVFSFEPFPESFNYLEKNKLFNGLNNLNIYPIGLMEDTKTLTMGHPPIDYRGAFDWFKKRGDKIESGCKTIFHSSDDYKTVKCNFVRGDSILKQKLFNKLHYVKIDTEGSELFVLKGLKDTLSNMKPILQIELNKALMDKIGIHLTDMRDYLINLGYNKFRLFGENQSASKEIKDICNHVISGSKDYVFYKSKE